MASDLRLMDCDLDRLVRGAATASPDGSTFWPTKKAKKGSLKFSDYQLHDNKRIWKLHIFLIFNWSLASLCTRTRHSIGREPMPQLLFTGANSRVNIRASLIVKMSMIPHKPFSTGTAWPTSPPLCTRDSQGQRRTNWALGSKWWLDRSRVYESQGRILAIYEC